MDDNIDEESNEISTNDLNSEVEGTVAGLLSAAQSLGSTSEIDRVTFNENSNFDTEDIEDRCPFSTKSNIEETNCAITGVATATIYDTIRPADGTEIDPFQHIRSIEAPERYPWNVPVCARTCTYEESTSTETLSLIPPSQPISDNENPVEADISSDRPEDEIELANMLPPLMHDNEDSDSDEELFIMPQSNPFLPQFGAEDSDFLDLMMDYMRLQDTDPVRQGGGDNTQ